MFHLCKDGDEGSGRRRNSEGKAAEMPGAGRKFTENGNHEAIHKSWITRKTTCNATNFELSSEHDINWLECEFEEICTMRRWWKKVANIKEGCGGFYECLAPESR